MAGHHRRSALHRDLLQRRALRQARLAAVGESDLVATPSPVKGAQPAGGGKWLGNVKFNGHDYDGTMQLVSKNFMTLKGCSGILCQTYEFTRI